jgi:hypothetical protein
MAAIITRGVRSRRLELEDVPLDAGAGVRQRERARDEDDEDDAQHRDDDALARSIPREARAAG